MSPDMSDIQLDDLIAKWSGCWCDEQMAWDHDPRVRDCPQHGSDDCRHMAEGIVVDLKVALPTATNAPTESSTTTEPETEGVSA